MTKITYLFGAGASANSLPVIKNFGSRLMDMIQYLTEKKVSQYNDPDTNSWKDYYSEHYKAVFDTIIKEAKWLHTEMHNHQTVDTLAKKFYHTDLENLGRLKKVLIIFFSYEQLFASNTILTREKELPDRRYDSFIASILKNIPNKLELYGNIKVVTWNYDIQLELAYQKYSNRKIFDIQRELQILPNPSTIAKSLNDDGIDITKFSMVKLNGSALLCDDNLENAANTIFDDQPEYISDKLKKLIEIYLIALYKENISSDFLQLFNYSWEMEKSFTNKYAGYNYNYGCAIRCFQEAEVLVIIGYSFPYFNREIDDNLMNHFGKSENFKKVYIQDIRAEEIRQLLIERYPYFRTYHRNLIPISNVDSFYMPHEL